MGNRCHTQTKSSIQFNISQGETLLQNFKFIKLLYRTRMTKVSLVYSQKEKSFRVLKANNKVQLCKLKRVGMPINEQLILNSIQSPFFVNMLQCFQDKENIYIILENMPNGSLREHLRDNGSMNQDQVKFLAICLLFSLNYLRGKKIIHFDIKPGNILIDQKGYFRICDFNLSKKNQKNVVLNCQGIGTYSYQAPQVLDETGQINHESDYYSLGLTLFESLTTMSARKVSEMDGQMIDEYLARNNISISCRSFIKSLLKQNPKSRLGSSDFNELWMHPWIALDASKKCKYYSKSIQSPIFSISNSLNDKFQNPSSTLQTSRRDFNEKNQGDDMVADLMVKNPKFQSKFVGFRTIKRYHLIKYN